jgi:hypothetical protein
LIEVVRAMRAIRRFLLGLALAAGPVDAQAEDTRAGYAHALDGRLALLVPAQVLDGPSFQASLGWRLALTPRWGLHSETGLVRTGLAGVAAHLRAPGQQATLVARAEQWTVPLLFGPTLQVTGDARSGLTLGILGGVAIGQTRARVTPVGVDAPRDVAYVSVDPLLRARAEWAVPMARGSVLIGLGWQQHWRAGPTIEPDLRVTGPFGEAGWRLYF